MQVFRTGQGRGAGPVDYVTGPLGLEFEEGGRIRRDVHGKPITYVRDPAPVIVAGDPATTEALIDSLDFKYKFKYTSGVLSCAPEDGLIGREKEKALIEDFERTAFAGLEADQYSILWVRHVHQGHHELHFVVPRVELTTGRALNICPPNYQKFFDPWRSLWNEREGWADPDDPARARLTQGRKGYQEKLNAALLRQGIEAGLDPKQIITEYLTARIETGMIQDRSGIIEALEDAGLEINRQGKDYISVRPEPGAKPIRLKGVIYDQQFNSEQLSQEVTTEDSAGQRADREPDRERIAELERDIAAAIERRAEYNRSRYQCAISASNQEHRADIEPTPDPSREPEISTGEGMGEAGRDRFLPLCRHLRRELGDDAYSVPEHREQAEPAEPAVAADREPDSAAGEDRKQNVGAHLSGDGGRALDRNTQGLRSQSWLDGWREKGSEIWQRIKGSYDRVRETFACSIGAIISAVRSGTAAKSATDGAVTATGDALAQASQSIERNIKQARVIMNNRNDELTNFKTNINLVDYAAREGYQIIKDESSRNSKAMRRGGDKIIISTDSDNHAIYFSVNDDNDHGTIIDFVQKRKKINLGQVRKELRLFAGLPAQPVISHDKPTRADKDTQQVIAVYSKTSAAIPAYLTNKRHINERIIKDPRFSSVIRVDNNNNAVFPHFDKSGLCGYELKNDGFTGFAKNGKKGIWHSANIATANNIVITESAIDALSHAQINTNQDTAYVSIAGSLSTAQPELLRGLMTKATERGARLVVALDNDEGGRKMTQQLLELARGAGATVTVDVPSVGKDWNDQLKHNYSQEIEHGLRM